MVALRGEGYFLKAHRSNKAARGDPLKFEGLHHVGKGPDYSVHPRKGGVVARGPIVDLISYLELARVRCEVSRNVGYKDFHACFVDDVGVHLEAGRFFHSFES